MLGMNNITQNRADYLQALPDRTWKEFFGETVRKAGLGAAMMSAGLGVSGFGGIIGEKRAEGAIVTSISADPQAIASGATHSIDGGGNVGYISYGTGTSSGVYLGNGWVLGAGHTASNGGPLTFGTGFNFNSSPGTVFSPSQVIIHPQYSDGGNHDLALLQYTDLNINRILNFADARPATGSDVVLSGYGRTGTPGGYTTQDGFIRAGTSRLLAGVNLPIAGYSSEFFGEAFFRPNTRPNDIRAHSGDSGGGVFTQSGDLFGIMIAASNSAIGRSTYFLDLSNPAGENRAWIDSTIGKEMVATPEPSSLLMFGIASAAFALNRLRSRRNKVT